MIGLYVNQILKTSVLTIFFKMIAEMDKNDVC